LCFLFLVWVPKFVLGKKNKIVPKRIFFWFPAPGVLLTNNWATKKKCGCVWFFFFFFFCGFFPERDPGGVYLKKFGLGVGFLWNQHLFSPVSPFFFFFLVLPSSSPPPSKGLKIKNKPPCLGFGGTPQKARGPPLLWGKKQARPSPPPPAPKQQPGEQTDGPGKSCWLVFGCPRPFPLPFLPRFLTQTTPTWFPNGFKKPPQGGGGGCEGGPAPGFFKMWV